MNIKKNIYISLLLLSSSSLLYGCSSSTVNDTSTVTENNTAIKENTARISAVGDIMVHGKQLTAQRNSDGTYNFENNFRLINKYIKNSDLSIANLETTINKDKAISSYPSFNSPSELLDSLKSTGFDVISTINNHSLDSGQSGVYNTINELKERGFDYVGTQLTEDEKNYIVKEINGINIGISSFSYAQETRSNSYLNGIPSGKSKNLLNTIDETSVSKSFDTIKKEVDLMKSENCDFIILNIHWGEEYKQIPSTYQKELARLLINEGVDVILGSHPHVVQPIEKITSDDGQHEGIVFYSLGNIISNQQEEEMGFNMSENGILPIIDIKKVDNDTYIENISYIPTWVHRKEVNSEKRYEYTIIPLNKDLEKIAFEENINLDDLITSLEDTKSAVNNDSINIY